MRHGIAGLLPAPKVAGLLPPPRVDMREVFKSLTPDGGGLYDTIVNTITSFIHFEEIVDSYLRRYPTRAPELYDTMPLVQPYGDIRRYSQDVQDAHAHELLQRIVDGGDLSEPTKVEMLMVLIEISKTTPMRHAPSLLACELARDVIGKKMQDVIDEVGLQEAYSGQLEKTRREMADAMKKKITRHQPDHEVWFNRVSLEKKQDIMQGIRVPDYLMVPAEHERTAEPVQLELI